MSFVRDFYGSTVGKKITMALTGLVLVGFVVGHMAGNLKIFAGYDVASGGYKIDHYGEFLREIGAEMLGHAGFLWIVRVVLLVCVVLHAVSGIQLARLNRHAKPSGYKVTSYRSANAASRTMLYGGLFLIVFITYHILHFTTGAVHYRGFVEGKVYANVFSAFQSPLIAGFYVVSMALLALHLYHGTWSMFQTLGVDAPRWNKGLRTIAKVVAVAMFVGFSSVPVAILSGDLPPPQTQQVTVS
jgi:succinate dehydrogenase / fumarate reductase cytochrome b subunit